MESRFARLRDAELRDSGRMFLQPRYLALGLSLFLAMYVATKFVLVIFNATDPAERWPLDLTPFGVLNLPDVPLAFLSALAAGVNAILHNSAVRKHRFWSLGVTASMVSGLLLALRWSPANLDMINIARLSVLCVLLGMAALDNLELLRTPREARDSFVESELKDLRESGRDMSVPPRAVARALKELETLVAELPESPPQGADEDYMRDLLTSMLDDVRAEPRMSADSTGEAPLSSARSRDEAAESAGLAPKRLDRPTSPFNRARSSPSALLDEARGLADRGKFEKAIKRLDRMADQDERFPGLWELAAEIYQRMGELDAAAECRRRAERTR